jgi:hypothetical protein
MDCTVVIKSLSVSNDKKPSIEFKDPYKEPRSPRIIRLSSEQNHNCCYCGIKTFLNHEDRNGWPSSRLATIDHIEAKFNGGRNTFENTVMSCQKCNTLKSSVDAMVFYYFIQNLNKEELYIFHYAYIWKKFNTKLQQIASTEIEVLILAWLWTAAPDTKRIFKEALKADNIEEARIIAENNIIRKKKKKEAKVIEPNKQDLKNNQSLVNLKTTVYFNIPRWLVICHCIVLVVILVLLTYNTLLLYDSSPHLMNVLNFLKMIQTHVASSLII